LVGHFGDPELDFGDSEGHGIGGWGLGVGGWFKAPRGVIAATRFVAVRAEHPTDAADDCQSRSGFGLRSTLFA
jgi:hypothetical protein